MQFEERSAGKYMIPESLEVPLIRETLKKLGPGNAIHIDHILTVRGTFKYLMDVAMAGLSAKRFNNSLSCNTREVFEMSGRIGICRNAIQDIDAELGLLLSDQQTLPESEPRVIFLSQDKL